MWTGELGSAWEGGLRTLGMVRWTNKIQAQWKTDEMIHGWTCLPPSERSVAVDIPTDRPIDGVDQTDWLLGKREHSAP